MHVQLLGSLVRGSDVGGDVAFSGWISDFLELLAGESVAPESASAHRLDGWKFPVLPCDLGIVDFSLPYLFEDRLGAQDLL